MEISLPISSLFIIAIDSVGIVLSLLTSLMLIKQKRKRHKSIIFFSILLLLAGLTLLNDMLTTSGISNRFKDLYFLPIYFSLSIGPLFYLLVKSKYYNSLRWYDYLHLVPPVVQAIIYLSIGFRSAEFKNFLWQKTPFPIYLEIESILFLLSIVGYGLMSKFILLKKTSQTNFFWTKDLRRWLLSFTNGFLLIAGMECCFVVGELFFEYSFSPFFWVVRSSTLVAFVIWISFNGIKQYYPNNIFNSKPTLKKKPLLDDAGLSANSKLLIALMEEEKVYLNPDLNLKILAEYIQSTEKTCSYTLSNGLNTNFNQFINEYRINAFKEKILEGQHQYYTLNSLAFDCGFDSKSTFNRVFKKSMNMSPSQYVKSIQKPE